MNPEVVLEIKNAAKKGFCAETIAEVLDVSIDEVNEVLKEAE